VLVSADVIRLLVIGTTMTVTMMFALWLLHLRMRNASVVDVGWAAGIGLLALLYAALGDGFPPRRILVAILGGVWSIRLAWHLAHRVAREPEDGRYVELRARWGGNITLKFLVFFLGQGLLDVLLAVPFLAASMNRSSVLHPLEIAGAILWLVSVIGEGVADEQLRRFKRDPSSRGRVCDTGLWYYSRHPNYFFEWLIWCAFAVFAFASPFGWLSLAGPALMLYFLLRVTGIPATEAHAVESRGDAYREYQRTTSAFVPLPKRGR
jgi:steroid 5-alpha reductase family enzyme